MNKTTDQINSEAQVEAVNEVVAMLNSAFEADPAAINALLSNRVPCNEALANHPTILVDKQPVPGDRYAVGMLGVVNAVVQTLTGHRVASMRSETADAAGAHEMLGFKAYLLPQIEPLVGDGTSKPVESTKADGDSQFDGYRYYTYAEKHLCNDIQAQLQTWGFSAPSARYLAYQILDMLIDIKGQSKATAAPGVDLSQVKTVGDSILQSLYKRRDPAYTADAAAVDAERERTHGKFFSELKASTLNAEAADTGPVKDGPKSKPWTIPGTGKVPTKYKSPAADTELETTFNCCLHWIEDFEFNLLINDPNVIWYGPHTCNGCGKSIVKSSIDTGGVALDFEHNSHYPNHVWKRHVCAGGAGLK